MHIVRDWRGGGAGDPTCAALRALLYRVAAALTFVPACREIAQAEGETGWLSCACFSMGFSVPSPALRGCSVMTRRKMPWCDILWGEVVESPACSLISHLNVQLGCKVNAAK